MASILVVEDEPVLARNLRDSLQLGGHDTVTAATGEDGLEAAQAGPPDLVLLDYRLPGIDGLEVIKELRRRGSSAAIVMMTAHGNIDTAVEAMKAGASDFLTKPLDLQELQLVVDRVLKHRQATARLDYFRQRERADSATDQIIGDSPAAKTVKTFIQRITASPALAADRPPSILITGETGTGKDLAARAIHYDGPRRDGQFVHVTCTAMPDHLVESELFGHIKGAFTDARTDKRGLFELADGGTVFLDEIGHMKPSLQSKLLTVLDQRSIRRVGSTRERKVDIHIIAATNRNLEEAIETGDMREDLYHRLRVLTLHMPPLRSRADDIVLLAEHFLVMHSARFGLPVQGFADEALDAMQKYDWPGNVRELMHTLESAVLISDGPLIAVEHLNIQPAEDRARLNIELPASQTTITFDFSGDGPKLDEIEHQIIQAALDHSKHNLSRAARILGISRDAVRYRLEKYGKRGAAESEKPA